MTIHWMSFFLGAPLWGSLGIVVFVALLAASKRASRVDEAAEADHGDAPDPPDPRDPRHAEERGGVGVSVVSLEERRRTREGRRSTTERPSRKRG